MNPKNRNLLIAIIIGLLVLCCCCLVVTAGVVIADPFGWQLLSRVGLGGQANPVAKAVPANAAVYAGLDLKALTSDKTARLLKAFADVPGASDYSSPEAAIKQIDQELQKQFGLTFTDDIQPWLGGQAGLAATQLPDKGSDTPTFVLIVEARDTKKADAFILKFVQGLVDNAGGTSSETDFEGIPFHVVAMDGEPAVIARSKNLVLIGNSQSALEDVIQVQGGKADSLAAAADYKKISGQLPSGSLLTVILGGPSLETLFQSYQDSISGSSSTPFGQTGLESISSLGLALSAIDEGAQLDSVIVYNENKLTDAQRQLLTARGNDKADRLLPDNTLVYVAGQGLDQAWANYRENADPNDVKDMLSALEKQFGFNPEEALFPYLQGNWLMALLPDTGSLLLQESPASHMGFVGLVETNDAKALGQTVETFNTNIATGGATVDKQTIAGAQAYVLSADDKTMGVYGFSQNQFVIASSEDIFTGVLGKDKALADVSRYQQIWRAFPSGAQRVIFADVTGLVQSVRSGMSGNQLKSFDKEVAPYLNPIQSVALGSRPLKNGVTQTTLIVFIASNP